MQKTGFSMYFIVYCISVIYALIVFNLVFPFFPALVLFVTSLEHNISVTHPGQGSHVKVFTRTRLRGIKDNSTAGQKSQ